MRKLLLDICFILIFYLIVLISGFILSYRVNASTVFTLYILDLLKYKVDLYLFILFVFVISQYLLIKFYSEKYYELILGFLLCLTFPLVYYISVLNIFFISVIFFILSLDILILSNGLNDGKKYLAYTLFCIFSLISIILVPESSILIGILLMGIFLEKEKNFWIYSLVLLIFSLLYFVSIKEYLFTIPLIFGFIFYFTRERVKYFIYPIFTLLFLFVLHFIGTSLLISKLYWFNGINFELISVGVIYLFLSVYLALDRNPDNINLIFLSVFVILCGSIVPYFYMIMIFLSGPIVNKFSKYISKISKKEYYYLVFFIVFVINIIFSYFVNFGYSKQIPVISIKNTKINGKIYSSLIPCLGLYYYNPGYSGKIICVKNISNPYKYKGSYVLISYLYDTNNTNILDILVPQYCIKNVCVYRDLLHGTVYTERSGILYKGFNKPQMILCQGGPSILLNGSFGGCFVKYKGLYFEVLISKNFSKSLTPVFFGLKTKKLEPIYVNSPENLTSWYVIVKVS